MDRVAASDYVRAASSLVAKAVGKPEAYVMVCLRESQTMCFAGTEDPTAFVGRSHWVALGAKKRTFSRTLCDFLQEKVGVPPNRTYIRFVSPQRSDFGFNGSTFQRW